MRRNLTLLSVITLCWPSLCVGEESGFYLQGGVGKSRYDINPDDLRVISVIASDPHPTQVAAALGYEVSKYAAVEVGYIDFGKATFTSGPHFISGSGCIQSPGSCRASPGSVNSTTTHFSMVGKVNLSDAWFAVGRLGAASTRSTVIAIDAFVPLQVVQRETRISHSELLYGGGIGYRISPSFSALIEYGKLNDTKVSAFNAGLRYKF